MLKSKGPLGEGRENILGDEVIRMRRKYLEFPNSCLVRDLVKVGRNILFDGIRIFGTSWGLVSYIYIIDGVGPDGKWDAKECHGL